jgi:SAM-dependent methyltransferase
MRAWMAEPVRDPASDTDTIDVLVLGVTVEIVTMPWPRTVRLTAFERSSGMIRAFWPGRLPGCRSVVRADWDAPPFRDEAFDIVVGDGIFNTRHYPNGYLELGMRIRSLLRPGGRLFVRGFTQLDVKEEPEQVIDAYDAGRITDYHALRFRLLTSLQASAAEGTWGNKDFIDVYGSIVATMVPMPRFAVVARGEGEDQAEVAHHRRDDVGRRVADAVCGLDDLRAVAEQHEHGYEDGRGHRPLRRRAAQHQVDEAHTG